MKIENIIKRLAKENVKVYRGEFSYQECWMAEGTALVDVVEGKVVETNSRWADVAEQIVENRSHIYTIEGNKKELTKNNKLGY